jgi:outer membrane protein assembly factor BamB
VSALLSGCWLQVGFDSGHTRFNDLEDQLTAQNVASLEADWSVGILQVGSEPMASGGRVFLVTSSDQAEVKHASVRAWSAATGAAAWATSLVDFTGPADLFATAPASFVGDELWAGASAALFGPIPLQQLAFPARLDPRDGSILDSETSLLGSPAVEAEGLVVQTGAGFGNWSVSVRDRITLTTLWSAFFAIPPPITAAYPPTVAEGQVFVVEDHVLHALLLAGCGAATCTPVWSVDLGSQPSPAVAPVGDDELFVVDENELLAIDRTTGTITWRAPLGTRGRLAISGDTIYVTTADSLQAFARSGCGAETCTPTGTTSLGAVPTTDPVVAGGVVYVGVPGAIEALDAAGAPLAIVPVSGIPRQLSVAGGRVFVVHDPGDGTNATLTSLAPG